MTCLCLTRNRPEWLPLAIQCFLAQTYVNRELLVVADGEHILRLLPVDRRISLVHHSGTLAIGEKRNLGCSRARGDIIAHWDDDDFSSPGRIAHQVAMLERSGKAVAGFRVMRFTDGSRWWRYRGEANYAIGTSLCYRADWWRSHPFAALQIGEDNDFVRRAWNAGQLETEDAGDLMHATIHPGNTSPRTMNDNWRPL